MISLITSGQYILFSLIMIALIISLSFHEFGHAYTAKLFGDDTAEKMGRVSLNPLVHLDPMGTAMLVLIGFGYAKPVPTDPRKFTSKYADLWVSAAGPFMNFLLAFIAINIYVLGLKSGLSFFEGDGARSFFNYFTIINLILMLFNLIPIGSLDGHYILPYFLPEGLRRHYVRYNHLYGDKLFLLLIIGSIAGFPIFENVFHLGRKLIPWIVIV